MRRLLRTVLRATAVIAALAFGWLAYLYLTLPDVRPLRTANPDTTAFIELRAREARSKGREPRRIQRWVPYSRISPNLTRAVLVSEDAKFWQHEGVDLEQLKESIEVNIERREFARGASTITQQLAKNLYLSPSKNPIRKLRELMIARRLEAELSKQRILELYLNVIEWGDGIYGAEAAARTYFRKSAAALAPHEAALLSGAIANPRLFDPARPGAALRRRQQMIMRRMGAVVPPPAIAANPGDPLASEHPALELVPDLPPGAAAADQPAVDPVPEVPSPAPPCDRPPCG